MQNTLTKEVIFFILTVQSQFNNGIYVHAFLNVITIVDTRVRLEQTPFWYSCTYCYVLVGLRRAFFQLLLSCQIPPRWQTKNKPLVSRHIKVTLTYCFDGQFPTNRQNQMHIKIGELEGGRGGGVSICLQIFSDDGIRSFF